MRNSWSRSVQVQGLTSIACSSRIRKKRRSREKGRKEEEEEEEDDEGGETKIKGASSQKSEDKTETGRIEETYGRRGSNYACGRTQTDYYQTIEYIVNTSKKRWGNAAAKMGAH